MASLSATAGLLLLIVASITTIAYVREARQKQEVSRLLAQSYLDRGLALCEQGDTTRGMLWLAHGLAAEPSEGGEFQYAIRANLANWRSDLVGMKARFEHQYAVAAVAFSPDGSTFLTGSASWDKKGEARIWDTAKGEFRAILEHERQVLAVAFSPDGKTVVTGSTDWKARVWDSASGKLTATLQHQAPVLAVSFSRDGQTLVTGSGGKYANKGRKARLWDVSTGTLIRPPIQHDGLVAAVALSPDGTTLVTGSGDWLHDGGEARLWDISTGEPIGAPLEHQGIVRAVAFSPDGRTVLTGSDDKIVRLWNAATGKVVRQLLQHKDSVRTVSYASMVLRPGRKALQHQDIVSKVVFSPDNRTVLTVARETAHLWDSTSGRPLSEPVRQRVGSQGGIGFFVQV